MANIRTILVFLIGSIISTYATNPQEYFNYETHITLRIKTVSAQSETLYQPQILTPENLPSDIPITHQLKLDGIISIAPRLCDLDSEIQSGYLISFSYTGSDNIAYDKTLDQNLITVDLHQYSINQINITQTKKESKKYRYPDHLDFHLLIQKIINNIHPALAKGGRFTIEFNPYIDLYKPNADSPENFKKTAVEIPLCAFENTKILIKDFIDLLQTNCDTEYQDNPLATDKKESIPSYLSTFYNKLRTCQPYLSYKVFSQRILNELYLIHSVLLKGCTHINLSYREEPTKALEQELPMIKFIRNFYNDLKGEELINDKLLPKLTKEFASEGIDLNSSSARKVSQPINTRDDFLKAINVNFDWFNSNFENIFLSMVYVVPQLPQPTLSEVESSSIASDSHLKSRRLPTRYNELDQISKHEARLTVTLNEYLMHSQISQSLLEFIDNENLKYFKGLIDPNKFTDISVELKPRENGGRPNVWIIRAIKTSK